LTRKKWQLWFTLHDCGGVVGGGGERRRESLFHVAKIRADGQRDRPFFGILDLFFCQSGDLSVVGAAIEKLEVNSSVMLFS
jgi:hypothetical protein